MTSKLPATARDHPHGVALIKELEETLVGKDTRTLLTPGAFMAPSPFVSKRVAIHPLSPSLVEPLDGARTPTPRTVHMGNNCLRCLVPLG